MAAKGVRDRLAAPVSRCFQWKISLFRKFWFPKSKVVVCNRRFCSAKVWTVMCMTHCRALFFFSLTLTFWLGVSTLSLLVHTLLSLHILHNVSISGWRQKQQRKSLPGYNHNYYAPKQVAMLWLYPMYYSCPQEGFVETGRWWNPFGMLAAAAGSRPSVGYWIQASCVDCMCFGSKR